MLLSANISISSNRIFAPELEFSFVELKAKQQKYIEFHQQIDIVRTQMHLFGGVWSIVFIDILQIFIFHVSNQHSNFRKLTFHLLVSILCISLSVFSNLFELFSGFYFSTSAYNISVINAFKGLYSDASIKNDHLCQAFFTALAVDNLCIYVVLFKQFIFLLTSIYTIY